MALIISGHPNLNKSIANRTIIERLKKSSLNTEVRNLQENYPDFKIDVKEEQKALLRHDTIVFQYPFYWYSMPAILKHWFDVVFEHQFAFGSKGDKLKGKNFLASFTVGAPKEEYHTLGKHHFKVYEFCKVLEQTAYYSQMNYLEPIFYYVTSQAAGYTIEQVKDIANKQADRLLQVLGESEFSS